MENYFFISLIVNNVVFIFDFIVVVNRFLLCIYCNVSCTHFILFIENAQYKY